MRETSVQIELFPWVWVGKALIRAQALFELAQSCVQVFRPNEGFIFSGGKLVVVRCQRSF